MSVMCATETFKVEQHFGKSGLYNCSTRTGTVTASDL